MWRLCIWLMVPKSLIPSRMTALSSQALSSHERMISNIVLLQHIEQGAPLAAIAVGFFAFTMQVADVSGLAGYSSWRRRKNSSSIPPDVFRSKGSSTPKGSWRGATGTRGRPHPRLQVGPQQGSSLPPVARLFAPFWLRDLFPEILCSEFSWNFWGFRSQVS